MLDGAALLELYQTGRTRDALTRAGLLGRAAVSVDGADDTDPMALPLGELDRRIWALRHDLFGAGPGAAVASCTNCGARLEFDLPADFVPPAASAPGAVQVEWRGASYPLRLPCLADFGPGGLHPENLGPGPWHDPDFAAHAAAVLHASDPALAMTFALTCPDCGAALDKVFDPATYLWAEIEDMARHLLHEVVRLARAFGWSETDILAMPPARRALYLAELTEDAP